MACTLASDDAATGWREDLETETGVCSYGIDILSSSNDLLVAAKIYVGSGKRDYVPMDKRVPIEGER